MTRTLKLGLIGDNIAQSKSPRLHRLAGQMSDIDVTYDRLVPKDLDMPFGDIFAMARKSGFRGINVTYPYKETVVEFVTVPDPSVRAIGAVNTVLFSGAEPQGYNTDYSGFIRAYRSIRQDAKPGVVCLIGAGGVGKAIAFALLALNASEIICVDLDRAKAQALATALSATRGDTKITVADTAEAGAKTADGIINCTPLGMVKIWGTPLAAPHLSTASWVFDAVYTPVETQFLQDAKAAGLTVISGYELFLGQGIDAWALFSGGQIDPDALRAGLAQEPA